MQLITNIPISYLDYISRWMERHNIGVGELFGHLLRKLARVVMCYHKHRGPWESLSPILYFFVTFFLCDLYVDVWVDSQIFSCYTGFFNVFFKLLIYMCVCVCRYWFLLMCTDIFMCVCTCMLS